MGFMVIAAGSLLLAQASDWDCRNWIREYDQLAAQIQYENDARGRQEDFARAQGGTSAILIANAAGAGRRLGGALEGLAGASPGQRLAELDAVIRQQCFAN